MRITDSEIAKIKQNFDVNYGIRIIHDKKIASIETTNQDEIPNVISNSIKNLNTLKKREFWKGLPSRSNFSKIQSTGKSVRIIHNLPTMLKNISSVGNNQQNVIRWASLPSITSSIKAEKIFVNSI